MSERFVTPTAPADSGVMAENANGTSSPVCPVPPDVIAQLTTADDTPVDNLASEKYQRLLTEPLYSSWPGPGPGRPFLATANVGLFWIPRDPAIVPDVLLSLDVTTPQNWWVTRSYLLWEFGKAPDVVIEIVSNTIGEGQGTKRATYAQIGIPYYIIYDPQQYLHGDVLAAYELQGGQYLQRPDTWLPAVGLGCGCGRARLKDGTTPGCAGATSRAWSFPPGRNALPVSTSAPSASTSRWRVLLPSCGNLALTRTVCNPPAEGSLAREAVEGVRPCVGSWIGKESR